MAERRIAIGRRIRRLRETLGLSRRQVAMHLAVDLTAVAAWEGGKYLPREGKRIRLAAFLGLDFASLFAEDLQDPASIGSAALVDTLGELPVVLRDLANGAERDLKAFRVAAPYATNPHVQEEFRRILDARLKLGTLEVQRIEIIYTLARLKEILSNIIRYDGLAYQVKCNCVGVKDVVPGMGGYIFDNREFLIGAYWATVPPYARPGLKLTGEPFRTYFSDYWSEIWPRGTPLNKNGAKDLSAVRQTAQELGIDPSRWDEFVEEARTLDVGDGIPPLI